MAHLPDPPRWLTMSTARHHYTHYTHPSVQVQITLRAPIGLLSLPRGCLAKPLGGKSLEDCLLHLDGQRLELCTATSVGSRLPCLGGLMVS